MHLNRLTDESTIVDKLSGIVEREQRIVHALLDMKFDPPIDGIEQFTPEHIQEFSKIAARHKKRAEQLETMVRSPHIYPNPLPEIRDAVRLIYEDLGCRESANTEPAAEPENMVMATLFKAYKISENDKKRLASSKGDAFKDVYSAAVSPARKGLDIASENFQEFQEMQQRALERTQQEPYLSATAFKECVGQIAQAKSELLKLVGERWWESPYASRSL